MLAVLLTAQIEQDEFIDPMSLDIPEALKVLRIPHESTEIPQSGLRGEGDTDILASEENVAGYRIQLVSTQDVGLAESVEQRARELFTEDVYLIFDYPNYKVRVGNFLELKAAKPTESLARRNGFPRAWTVPSDIEFEAKNEYYGE